MILKQNVDAIAFSASTPFKASGGVPPYVYSVAPGGAGGTIDASTGLYTAPSTRTDESPDKTIDTITVTDSTSDIASADISVLSPIELFCDVLKTELGLSDDQVILYNQKLKIPSDSRLYIAVSILTCKPFANTNTQEDVEGIFSEVQTTNFQSVLSIDVYSRSTIALTRKEDVIMSLKSTYAEQQMNANAMKIASIPSAFTAVNQEDGAAIPYRFNISVAIQYMSKKVKAIEYYDDFDDAEVTTDL